MGKPANSQVKQAGFVRFDPSRDGGTHVGVQMEYLPPAGALGHAVAQLFGVDPRQAMNDDLIRLKSLLETGKTSSSKGTAELGSGKVDGIKKVILNEAPKSLGVLLFKYPVATFIMTGWQIFNPTGMW